jgi:hypothetical protein
MLTVLTQMPAFSSGNGGPAYEQRLSEAREL